MLHTFVTGLSYKTAPVSVREQFAATSSEQEGLIRSLKANLGLLEVVALWTCNRVEIYGVCEGGVPAANALMQSLVGRPLRPGSEFYQYVDDAAVRHLFSVASGLDSMVLGETEITGQVKNAYERARVAGHTGRRLNKMFQKALETAKEIRTTTAVGKGAASVGSVAVQHARKIFGSELAGRKVMVIGAGDMAEKCLKHLVKKGVASIVVVNRSMDRAEALAATFGGTAVPFGSCLSVMEDVDIVITSTGSPHIILEKQAIAAVMARRLDRPLAIIDIAVPRDVAPDVREIPGVYLHDIGDLESTVRETIKFREQDLALCRSIIEVKGAELANAMVPALAV